MNADPKGMARVLNAAADTLRRLSAPVDGYERWVNAIETVEQEGA